MHRLLRNYAFSIYNIYSHNLNSRSPLPWIMKFIKQFKTEDFSKKERTLNSNNAEMIRQL